MVQIERVRFDDAGPGHCGVAISQRNNRPHIHVFEIAENDGPPLNACFADGFQAIRDRLSPGTPMSDIDWEYTNGICHSDITFEEQNGILTRIHLNGNTLGGDAFKSPLKRYQEALNSPHGFEHEMTSGHNFIRGPETDIFPIRLGGTDRDKIIYYTSNNYNGMTPVLVDASKFVQAWREQEERLLKPDDPPSNKAIGFLRSIFSAAAKRMPDHEGRMHDFALFQSTQEKSRQEIWANTCPQHPIQAAFISFNADQSETPIAFINGRHRTFNAANLAAPFVVIDVGGDVDAFRKQFEWIPPSPVAPIHKPIHPLAQPWS